MRPQSAEDNILPADETRHGHRHRPPVNGKHQHHRSRRLHRILDLTKQGRQRVPGQGCALEADRTLLPGNIGRVHPMHLTDIAQGKGPDRLAALHEQGPDHPHGQRQPDDKGGADAGPGCHTNSPPQVADVLPHHIQPHPPA